MHSTRREFIRNTTLATTGMLLSASLPLWANEEKQTLTLLHTNDVHSRLDPFPMDGGKFQGLGGVIARDRLIQKIRKESAQVLLLDAGDMFQGTPYFNYFKGEPEITVMNLMGYDAGTLGNHDFDNGIDGLVKQLRHAEFPIVNCNYDFSQTALEHKILPYTIKKKGDLKIGIFGVGILLQGLVPDALCEGVTYKDPIECANEMAYYLKKNKRCDYVVCLSHLGFEYKDNKVSDKVLAKETDYVDCIIGGHTHTFLDEVHKTKNRKNQEVIVNQVGWAGINLGRINIFFSHNTSPNYASDLSSIKIDESEI
ncbi:MAG: metallophosphoesterase [Chitinophagaceae bacterium]|nr:metallophosphoesterase [Chitinophagaceae bacterium]